jgi:hypothetical protein
MAEKNLTEKEPKARLVEAAEVGPEVEVVRRVLAELTDHLRSAPIEQLEAKLRGWDNYQRASLGRGETQPLLARDIKSSFSLAKTGFESRGEPALPLESEVPALADLDELVRLAARLAVPAAYDNDHLIVGFFLFRVIVRAGQRYKGFLHRDISDNVDAPVGGVIIYPTVTSSNIDGANLDVYLSDQPTEELERDKPDVTFAPYEYEHAAVVLGYPHNLAHGVRTGTNPHPVPETATGTREDNLREFLEPHETTFWKDMAVLTFSKTSTIEDDIV